MFLPLTRRLTANVALGLPVLGFTLSLACTATPDGQPSGADSTTQGTTDGMTGGTTPTQGADDTTGTSGLSGQVVDASGDPLQDVRVVLCREVCRYTDTGADGSFSYSDLDASDYSLHLTILSEDSTWADVLLPIHLDDGEQRELASPVPFAQLGATTRVTATADVEAAPGLWISVSADQVDLPLGADTLDMAGATPATLPPELPAHDVLGVWYLDPFDAKSKTGMTVRIDNDWGLKPGEQALLYASSYEDYAWIDGGTVTATSDGAQLEGGSVTVLSTLVLARAPADNADTER